MPKPLIAVASLGGTITMTSSSAQGVTPTLSAEDLVASVPAVADVASLQTNTIATKPGASLTTRDLKGVLAWARTEVDAGASGAIVIQGTDTIEETSYFLDLHWDRDAPLIVTGAMRHPSAPGADGPSNLLSAITVAATAEARSRGVLVILNETIHAARWVQKRRGSGLDAFVSTPFGPLGFVEEGKPCFNAAAGHKQTALATPIVESASPKVALLRTHLEDDGSLLKLAVDAGYNGVVIGAFGVGHVPATLAEVVSEVVPRIPVVITTATGAGPTFTKTYGFIGSESDLLSRGAIGAGWLTSTKARILLSQLIACEADHAQIATEFATRGASC